MNIQFAVDAALLHELGERLIGRPAIALGELIKNSFDADATTCRIELSKDEIIISDDGTGMSENDFLNYWMRIGTTHKVDQGTSKKLGRPLTGSKGIGRLSAQFLADEMTLESTSEDDPAKSLYAFVDWTNAVKGKDLSTVNVDWERRSDSIAYPNGNPAGTRITLKKLKNEWNADFIRDLGGDVWMLRSPFKRQTKGERRRGPEDFEIDIDAPEIADARKAFDETLENVFSNWKARVRGTVRQGRTGSKAVVYAEFRPGYPEGSKTTEPFREVVSLPLREHGGHAKSLVDRATFEILIFKPEGKQRGGIEVQDLRDYLAKFGNVSVYDGGFRLPYYGSGRDAAGQDWLSIALDQGRRLNASELLPENLQTPNKYMQNLPAPGRIFGAVEIDTNHERTVAQKAGPGEWLQIQPGRDRLHDNPAFFQLRDLVRFSLDFYANRYRLLALQAVEKHREQEPPSKKYDRAMEVLEQNKDEMPASVFRQIRKEVADARKASVVEEEAIDRRAALLAPLAAAGMAALALNHEISRESGFLDRIGVQLRRIAKKHSIEDLGRIADELDEAKNRLDSLRELFAPLLSDMDKSATDRLKVRAVVEQAVGSMRVLMPGVKFDLSGIPIDLRFPVGSLAEWNALLQNVLSNAWNALLDSKKAQISFRGGRDGRGGEWLRISDTGQGLDIPLSDAHKLFEPFERRIKISADKRSIAIGGQGLGLAIVRMIARRRGAKVAFVSPVEGFSTTFEISWRGVKG
ncbi:MAG TPA: ATP-binding protein [Candidatus Binatia bacterium]